MTPKSVNRDAANREAHKRLCEAAPVLTGVRPAIEALPGMTRNTVLTSGAPLDWHDYEGGQRAGLIGGALFEGLAKDAEEAEAKFASGELRAAPCSEFGCVGSLAGIYTASMPVFVVEDKKHGTRGFCNMYEGKAPKRLNYGVYDDEVRGRLLYINDVVGPLIAEAVRASGGIPLKSIMKRALHMGDELHSRNTAASLLFAQTLFPFILDLPQSRRADAKKVVELLTEDHYFFLRLSMASAAAIARAAWDIPGSSVVTAMAFSCKDFAIRVSGLGGEWFRGPHPKVRAKLFDGHSEDEIAWMGGESPIVETIGAGGFAQAAAFPLQAYQGGTPEDMMERNRELYKITVGEHTDFHIPALRYRGTPTGIDVFKVVETGILPTLDIGIAGKGGGQIGAGIVWAPMACFETAKAAWERKYGKG